MPYMEYITNTERLSICRQVKINLWINLNVSVALHLRCTPRWYHYIHNAFQALPAMRFERPHWHAKALAALSRLRQR